MSFKLTEFRTSYYDRETLRFHLNRDSNETVGKTLQRMEMTLSKKLLTKSSKSKAKKQQHHQQQHPRGQRGETTTPHAAPLVSSSIWNVDADTGQLHTKWDETTLSTLTNQQVWGHVAVHNALAIQLELLTDNNNNNSDPPAVAAAAPPTMILHLLVESCPPTIIGVHTFSDFESHLFVGVPLLVNVETLFADRTVVDWYCNGECVQQDNPCYVPKPSDVGKDLAVLLRPIRIGQKEEQAAQNNACVIMQPPVVDARSAAHDGNGCEDAYRFKRCIEERPENTIVNLRTPAWTSLRKDNNQDDQDNQQQQQQQQSAMTIRVLSYNILADQNCFDSPGHVCRSYASYLSADILRKQRRLPLVLSEILSYQADIICLQEVDESVFERLFEPILGHYNYQGYFSCKASDGTREGCATFWSLQAFEHVPIHDRKRHILRHVFANEQRIQDDEEEDWASMADIQSLLACRPALRHVVTTVLGHILQLVPLTLKSSVGASKSPIVWVANTHLYFHPYASHIRLMQMYAICQQISRELKEYKQQELNNKSVGSPSIIICGDFNSSLTNAAGKLLIDRHVPANFRDLKNHLQQFRYKEDSDNGNKHGTHPLATDKQGDGNDVDFPEIRLPHHFPRFQSALHETPPVTHFIPGFSGALDHILISEYSRSSSSNDSNEEGAKLVSVRSAPMPSMRDVARDTAMPSPVLPSDHVSILVELRVSTT